nr:reverse transcriptase domain-containing protein [Tanacetum cinerariifolium]
MSTRSFARNLFPPLDNPEHTIRRRSRADPTLLNDFEMATEGNGHPPVPDLRTMEELRQPYLNGRGGPIAPIAIQAMNFGLKNDMIQQVQNSCQLHGLPGDDANKHLDKFLHVTQSIKVNGVTDDALRFDEITNFRQRPDESLFEAWERYKLLIDLCPTHNMLPDTQIDTFYNGLNLRHRYTINAAAAQRSESSISITSSSDTKIAALKTEMAEINKNLMRVLQVNQQVKAITPNCETYSGPHSFTDCPAIVGQTQNIYAAGAYQVERKTKVTKDMVHPTNNGGTKDVQPPVVQTESSILNSEPMVAPIIEPVAAPFGPPIKTLLTNKDKLYELARTPLNENCSVVLLKKFLEKLGDPDKFLIPCDFSGMAECLALADLGASINLMSLSVWNKLSLPELSLTCMTLELADHLISCPVGVAEDVFVKVGTFHFSADFVVIDFDADPRVPLILGRSFLKTERALIDVFERELTIRVGKESITFNLDQTSRYSANYNDMTANQIDVIDMACEEYSQEVLGFSDVIASGNPTPYYDPVVSTSFATLTSFGDSDFLLEEVDAFLALEDDPTSLKVDQSYELKICEAKIDKSLIDEPPDVELKDLPPHLEYAFLEGDDKFPVIITKDLSVEEKTALITVLKSHKRAIAWKLSDIKGIDPEFCTYKILMKDDFEPAVQHQRRVNPKIH